MNKIFKAILLIGILISFITGCSKNKYMLNNSSEKEVLTSISEEVTESSLAMSYNLFTGYRSKIIKLDQCETCEISINVVSNSGNLTISIIDGSGKVTYEETEIPTSSFSLSLAGGDTYTIKVNTSNHVGSFNVNFCINE